MAAPTFKKVTLNMSLTATETVTLGPGDSVDVSHAGMNTSVTSGYTPTSTPPAQAVAPFTVTLSSGTATIDLTSLTYSNGVTLDAANGGAGATAMRVQHVVLQAPETNTNPISIAPSSSNGYKGSGGGFIFITGGSVDLTPGDKIQWSNLSGTAAPLVSGTVKDLTLTGTGSSDQLNITLILG